MIVLINSLIFLAVLELMNVLISSSQSSLVASGSSLLIERGASKIISLQLLCTIICVLTQTSAPTI